MREPGLIGPGFLTFLATGSKMVGMRVFTQAPAAYDYGYTTEVEAEATYELYPGRVVTGRIVEIPEEAATYQTARYQSGLYMTQAV